MDGEQTQAPAALTPDREVEMARAALAAGDVAAAAAHLARALARDVGRREWLILLDEIVKAGDLDPDRIAPLGERPYFALVAVHAYVLARRRQVTKAVEMLLRIFAEEPRVPFLRWGASWLSAQGVAAKVDIEVIVAALSLVLDRFPGDDLDEAQREALEETLPLLEQLEEAHAGSERLAWARSAIDRKLA